MNKITRLISTAFLTVISIGTIVAQDMKPCISGEMTEKFFEANPSLKKQYLDELQMADAADKVAFASGYKEPGEKAMATVYTIPVVFHIIHLGGTENISDAQVADAVRILNDDYRKLNTDISAVVPAFTSITADCEIQFRLAQKDPSGNCTNGIDRIYSAETNIGDDGSKLNVWPRNKYLNIWVVKTITSGAAGYAYTPGSAAFNPTKDGIIILSTYIGSIGTGNLSTSRALTHEVGHYLNLQHTWGGTNQPGCDGTSTVSSDPCFGVDNCTTDDGVTDTPNTIGWTSCNLAGNTCGVLDNVQNFMDYSYCSNMFTAGQRTRMRSALTSTTSARNNLWTTGPTGNLVATGVGTPEVLCFADFQSDKSTSTICQGDSLTFTDLAWNGTPTSWAWTFPGGTPSSSTDSIPTITYNTPGVYNVTLVVSNGSGSVNASKTAYVTVFPNTATYNAAIYSEGFEGSAIPNVDWNIYNANSGSNTWTQTTAAAATGTKSVRIVNASTYDTNVDDLISPPINISAIVGTPSLTYKLAHAQKTTTSADKLQIYVSSDCGNVWSLRQTLTGATLSTAGVISASFVPTASQWVQKTLSLSSVASATSLLVKFKFTSDAGNNIYLDDINIMGNVGIDEFASNINFNVYPNPAEENTVISFNLLENKETTITIYDVVGKEISSVFKGNLVAGEHQYVIAENTKLSAGVYFIRLTAGKDSFTKKLIVK